MDNNQSGITRREALLYIGGGAASVLLSGCVDIQRYNYGPFLTKPLRQIINERPVYEGELYFVEETKKGVKDIKFDSVPGVNFQYLSINGKLFITPTYAEGTEKGIKDVTYTVNYKDGSTETKTKSISFTPETKGEREARYFSDDQKALTNLRRGAWVTPDGKRFTPQPDKSYIRGLDFVRADPYLTKKGRSNEADMDIQQSFNDFGKALSGKATYCYFDNGKLRASTLRGLPQSIDYLAQALLDALSNTTELGVQALALDDGGAQNIAITYDTLDSMLQIAKDATVFGGAHIRTWAGALDLLGDKKLANLEDGKSLREVLGDDYYASVRKSGLRTVIDVTSTAAFYTLLTIAIVKCAEGGDGRVAGVIVEEQPPLPPWSP